MPPVSASSMQRRCGARWRPATTAVAAADSHAVDAPRASPPPTPAARPPRRRTTGPARPAAGWCRAGRAGRAGRPCEDSEMPSTATIEAIADRDRRAPTARRARGACAGRASRCAGRRRPSCVRHHPAVAELDAPRQRAGDLAVVGDDDDRRALGVQLAQQRRRCSAPVRLSRLPVGSSANTIAGRADAARGRSPRAGARRPRAATGGASSRWPSPTRSSASRARARRSPRRRAGVEQPGGDVVERAHPVEQEELLEDEADPARAQRRPARGRRARPTSSPATRTDAARRPLERAHDVQQRRLARAGRPDDGEQLARAATRSDTPRSASTPPG